MQDFFKGDIDNALTRFPLLAVALWVFIRFGLPIIERRRMEKDQDETEHQVAKEV